MRAANQDMIKNVEIQETESKGKGLFALKDFKKGETIFRNQRGRIVKKKDLPNLSEDDSEHLNELDWEVWEIMNPPGRFINHSCDPNAVPTESSDEATYIVLRSIKRGEEITVDYRINAYDGNTWECRCGSKNCSGRITSNFFTLDKRLQKKYLPYAPKFIRDEYKRRATI